MNGILWFVLALAVIVSLFLAWALRLVSRMEPQRRRDAELWERDARRECVALRNQVTIAEDGLREILKPDCGLHQTEDGYPSMDSGAYTRVADGTLDRMKAVDVEWRKEITDKELVN